MDVDLPVDYLAYLDSGGASEAFTDGLPGYFMLWHPNEIESANSELRVSLLAPGFVGFGTDGGGEMLAFDQSGAVFMLPLVGMSSRYAKKIGECWSDVSQRITKEA